jgi:hypothetical protein
MLVQPNIPDRVQRLAAIGRSLGLRPASTEAEEGVVTTSKKRPIEYPSLPADDPIFSSGLLVVSKASSTKWQREQDSVDEAASKSDEQSG